MENTFITHIGKTVIRPATSWLTGFVLMAMTFSSCKKNGLDLNATYALKVFNGLDGSINLIGNYNGDRPEKFRTALSIPNRMVSINSFFTEENISATYFALPDTLAKDEPVLKQDLHLAGSGINTLFIMGDKSNADFLFAPLHHRQYKPGDSLTYLTIVNISNDQPVSVNIKGHDQGSLVNQLPYKTVSEVIELEVPVAISAYSIEFRDAASGDSLTTYVLNNQMPVAGQRNNWLYKNSSLVLVGKRGDGGSDKLGVFRILHD